MTKKRLTITLIVLTGLFIFYKLADMFAPGSYPHAEHYELNYSEDKVIEAITNLKNSDSELIVPKVTIQGNGQFDLNDGKERETDYWYKFYFYDKKKDEIIFTWTRPAGQNTTTFAFVSIKKGLDLRQWKDINDDLGFFENKKIKKHFEETILKKIKENLDNNQSMGQGAAHNSTCPKGGVTCFYDTFVVNGSIVVRMNICATKPAHRKCANRYQQC